MLSLREKKWVTIGETTMKIYKWVPISSSEQVGFFSLCNSTNFCDVCTMSS